VIGGVAGTDKHADPAVALISGEAGIGKTRLVAELVANRPVLAGQGSLEFVGVGAIYRV
jgi:predicted ATP-dependent serine protease